MATARNIVVKFYESAGILSKNYLLDILHEDVQMEWYSSKGYLVLDYNDILAMSKDMRSTYDNLRTEIIEVVAEGDKISIVHSYYVRTIENPEEEIILATFFTIWEVKDGKLFKGIQMSQLGKR
ncbi:nuclear transport factor 2 family protein [Capnocytophaga sp. ARDL2]|uniref:nuclear transport factor 2 family protein n=1 Tax=Capnocytophaga sp. ARDL2 TaxID=3238809 RepID=UPI003555DFFC